MTRGIHGSALAAAAIFATTLAGVARAEDVKTDPPSKNADPSGQPSPQGHPGRLETDSTKGSPPTSPQGETPNAQQAKPKGSDNGTEQK